jgi:hypothetical protein
MKEFGYEVKGRDDDGGVVFKPPKSYLGRAFLSADGELSFGKKFIGTADRTADNAASQSIASSRDPRPTGTERPNGQQPPMGPVYDSSQQTGPQGTAPFTGSAGIAVGFLPSKRKTRNTELAVREGVAGELDRYRRVVRGSAIRAIVWGLPARLDALWESGQPIYGDVVLPDRPARRAAVLDYWATRPDTEEGQLVCKTVEDWLLAVVQTSRDPLTDAEIAEATARRTDGRHPLGD